MKLTIICSWCGVKIDKKDCDVLDQSLPRITHSICQTCCARVLECLEQPNDKITNSETLKSKGKEKIK